MNRSQRIVLILYFFLLVYCQMKQDDPIGGTNCHYTSNPPITITACDKLWWAVNSIL
jgi:hypothetical protein